MRRCARREERNETNIWGCQLKNDTDASLKRRRLWHDTRGFTAVFLALTLSVLIGFSALGVEYRAVVHDQAGEPVRC